MGAEGGDKTAWLLGERPLADTGKASGLAEADFSLFLPGCEEVFLRAVFTRLEEAFTTWA